MCHATIKYNYISFITSASVSSDLKALYKSVIIIIIIIIITISIIKQKTFDKLSTVEVN